MPHLPVLPDIYRVTFNWLGPGGLEAHNVFHYLCTGTDAAGIGAKVESATAAITGEPFAPISSEMSCHTLNILPLDGVTPTFEYTFEEAQPTASSTGEPVPEASVLVSFQSDHRGPQGRGRAYLGPVGENNMDSGLVAPDTLPADLQDHWQEWLEALQTEQITQQVVSYKHHDSHDLQNFGGQFDITVRPFICTQVRRLRSLR